MCSSHAADRSERPNDARREHTQSKEATQSADHVPLQCSICDMQAECPWLGFASYDTEAKLIALKSNGRAHAPVQRIRSVARPRLEADERVVFTAEDIRDAAVAAGLPAAVHCAIGDEECECGWPSCPTRVLLLCVLDPRAAARAGTAGELDIREAGNRRYLQGLVRGLDARTPGSLFQGSKNTRARLALVRLGYSRYPTQRRMRRGVARSL